MRFHLSITKPTRTLIGSLALILLGCLLWVAFSVGLKATNTTSFCISCHEMENHIYQEYQHTAHAINASGVVAGCPDCHVPKPWFPMIVRKIKASVELYHWLAGTIDTREKFDARRPLLAERVWKTMRETDSRECRSCHDFERVDLSGQARFAARIHRDGLGEGKTCIDCHQGITHQLPAPPQQIAEQQTTPNRELMEYGEEINETCAGCHGENAEGSIDGEYPRLAGMNRDYLIRQLKLFKKRDRLNIPMVPYTNERELPAEDIEAVASYIASIKLPTRLAAIDESVVEAGQFDALGRLEESRAIINIARYPGNADAGARVYGKECATCHGSSGEGNYNGNIPPLSGQHSVYIQRQIENFRNGERMHDAAEDADIFKQFGNGEIDDILAFLSIQDD